MEGLFDKDCAFRKGRHFYLEDVTYEEMVNKIKNYQKQNNPEKAIEFYNKYAFLFTASVDAGLLTLMGDVLCDIGNFDVARRFANRAYGKLYGNKTPELRSLYRRIDSNVGRVGPNVPIWLGPISQLNKDEPTKKKCTNQYHSRDYYDYYNYTYPNSGLINRTTAIKINDAVTVKYEDNNSERTYVVCQIHIKNGIIVSEADPERGLISEDSLLGENLLGKRLGDRVELKLPHNKKRYCMVIKIKHD